MNAIPYTYSSTSPYQYSTAASPVLSPYTTCRSCLQRDQMPVKEIENSQITTHVNAMAHLDKFDEREAMIGAHTVGGLL